MDFCDEDIVRNVTLRAVGGKVPSQVSKNILLLGKFSRYKFKIQGVYFKTGYAKFACKAHNRNMKL